jgi:hypothetical protein
MPPPSVNLQEVKTYLALLKGTLARFSAAAAGQDEGRLSARPGPEAWSANQILAHLRGCADVWTHSIYAMLIEEVPELPNIAPRAWARRARYASRPFRDSFLAFSLQRQELLAVLRKLPAEEWDRTALIGGRVHSVFSQVRRMALHEEIHCEQLEQVLGELEAGA